MQTLPVMTTSSGSPAGPVGRYDQGDRQEEMKTSNPWYAACFLCFWKWSRVSEVLLAWNITTPPPKKNKGGEEKERKEMGGLSC